jgi:N-acetylglucosamine-6-phosphate deacetylase
MGSLNPTRVIGADSRLGSLEPGKDASLIVTDDELRVHLAMVKGRVVFPRS